MSFNCTWYYKSSPQLRLGSNPIYAHMCSYSRVNTAMCVSFQYVRILSNPHHHLECAYVCVDYCVVYEENNMA